MFKRSLPVLKPMKYADLLSPRTAKVTQDASFLRRMCGFLIDLLIIDLLITAPFTPIFSPYLGVSIGALPASILAAAITIFLIIYCYFVLFEYLLGQTMGMMLVNTKVEGRTGILSLLVRNSILLPFLPFVLFWVIEPISIIFWKRGAMEQFSKTRTVYQRDIIW
jgi:hypothetical protein